MKTIYYSEKTKKQYDTEAECVQAEKQYDLMHSVELKAREEKKAFADKVTKSFVAVYEAEKAFDDAYEKARIAFKKAVTDAEATLNSVREENEKLIKEFCEKYPEGYHQTIKLDENHEMTVSRSSNNFSSFFDLFKF